MKGLFVACIATVAFCGAPALAADMAVKAPPPAPVAVPPYSWTGFYVGGNAGWQQVSSAAYGLAPDAATLGLILTDNMAFPGSLRHDDWEGGGQVGYNWQKDNWVLGLEADIQDSNSHARASANSVSFFGRNQTTTEADLSWFGTVRARAGWLVTPSTLLYGTGGYAYGQVFRSLNVVQDVPAGCALAAPCLWNGSSTHIDSGWTLGGGIEQKLPNSKFTFGLEYLFIRFDSGGNFSTACANAACLVPPRSGQAVVSPGSIDNQVIRAKLNLQF